MKTDLIDRSAQVGLKSQSNPVHFEKDRPPFLFPISRSLCFPACAGGGGGAIPVFFLDDNDLVKPSLLYCELLA